MGIEPIASYQEEVAQRRFRWSLAGRMFWPLSVLDRVLDPTRTDSEAIERDWERELAHQGRNGSAIDDALVVLGLPPGELYGAALRHVHERRPRGSEIPRWRRAVIENATAARPETLSFRRWLVAATSRTVGDWERRGMPGEREREAMILSVALHERLQRARLSARERLVVSGRLRGERLADIARREGLQPSTVREYFRRGMRRLGM